MIKIGLFHYTTWWHVLILLIVNTAEISELVCSAHKLAGAHME